MSEHPKIAGQSKEDCKTDSKSSDAPTFDGTSDEDPTDWIENLQSNIMVAVRSAITDRDQSPGSSQEVPDFNLDFAVSDDPQDDATNTDDPTTTESTTRVGENIIEFSGGSGGTSTAQPFAEDAAIEPEELSIPLDCEADNKVADELLRKARDAAKVATPEAEPDLEPEPRNDDTSESATNGKSHVTLVSAQDITPAKTLTVRSGKVSRADASEKPYIVLVRGHKNPSDDSEKEDEESIGFLGSKSASDDATDVKTETEIENVPSPPSRASASDVTRIAPPAPVTDTAPVIDAVPEADASNTLAHDAVTVLTPDAGLLVAAEINPDEPSASELPKAPDMRNAHELQNVPELQNASGIEPDLSTYVPGAVVVNGPGPTAPPDLEAMLAEQFIAAPAPDQQSRKNGTPVQPVVDMTAALSEHDADLPPADTFHATLAAPPNPGETTATGPSKMLPIDRTLHGLKALKTGVTPWMSSRNKLEALGLVAVTTFAVSGVFFYLAPFDGQPPPKSDQVAATAPETQDRHMPSPAVSLSTNGESDAAAPVTPQVEADAQKADAQKTVSASVTGVVEQQVSPPTVVDTAPEPEVTGADETGAGETRVDETGFESQNESLSDIADQVASAPTQAQTPTPTPTPTIEPERAPEPTLEAEQFLESVPEPESVPELSLELDPTPEPEPESPSEPEAVAEPADIASLDPVEPAEPVETPAPTELTGAQKSARIALAAAMASDPFYTEREASADILAEVKRLYAKAASLGGFDFPELLNVLRAKNAIAIEGVAPKVLSHARELIAKGNVREAQELLILVGDAEIAEVALALGQTYDPSYLASLNKVDVKPSVPDAERWYRRWYDLTVQSDEGDTDFDIERLIRGINAL